MISKHVEHVLSVCESTCLSSDHCQFLSLKIELNIFQGILLKLEIQVPVISDNNKPLCGELVSVHYITMNLFKLYSIIS